MPGVWYPWWGNYLFDNRLRCVLHRPEKIVGPWARPGVRVLDLGCGMGFFAVPMAGMVGEEGRVTALDLRPGVLAVLRRRARRAGVAARIETHCCPAEELELGQSFDFALAFWALHEVEQPARVGRRLAAHLEPGAHLLVAEPWLHVRRRLFEAITRALREASFQAVGRPKVPVSYTMLFRRPPDD